MFLPSLYFLLASLNFYLAYDNHSWLYLIAGMCWFVATVFTVANERG